MKGSELEVVGGCFGLWVIWEVFFVYLFLVWGGMEEV